MKRICIILFSVICTLSIYGKHKSSKSTQSSSPSIKIEYSLRDDIGTDPGVTSEVVKERLAALPTEMEMRYTDEVLSYINSFMTKGRKRVTNFLALSSYYMPIFEKALKDAGLPDELKYLPIIESGLDPKATSYAGAAGLWQFMPITAKGHDMRITSSIDERRDPYISSVKAAELLKKNYEKFGDWGLALAAYNAGAGTVQKALKRAGGDPKSHTFWTVYNYLPAQTRHYVPKFIAMNYIMNYYPEHNIPEIRIDNLLATETISMVDKISFQKVASMINVTVDELRALNPHCKGDVVPGSDERPCNLIIPAEYVVDFRLQQGLEAQPEMMASNELDKTSNNKSDKRQRRHNPNSDNYEDVPSQTNPNTYVRKMHSQD